MWYLSVFVALLIVSGCRLSAAAGSGLPTSFRGAPGSFGLVHADSATWLPPAPPFFYADGKKYSLEDKSLKVLNSTRGTGFDKLGKYIMEEDVLSADGRPIIISVKDYDDVGIVTYEQIFPDGLQRTSVGDSDKLVTGFPCFKIDDLLRGLGFLSYGGDMFGDDQTTGRWSSASDIKDGVDGGPLILFDSRGQLVLVLSTYSQFMISSLWHDKDNHAICYGVMGSVTEIPKDFTTSTIAYIGTEGINRAMEEWGRIMRFTYDRHIDYRLSDLTLNYLGFWTDGGAFYFYNTEPNKNYEETILEVKAYAENVHLPYKYVQYDSWWYFKDNSSKEMCTEWEPMPDVFPHGLRYMWDKTKWPASCHNRQWSHLVKYAKQNGGEFDFIVESGIAIPQDPRFWEYLFNNAKHWGLITYEQDHLDQQFDETSATRTDVHVARNWMVQMGEAARKNGITMQYCMSYPRHDLQSLEIPAVTHARVSGDYRPGEDNWKIGITSMFAEALGIAPFKDNFFTSNKTEPGNPYNETETHPALHAAVSTFSTAPVAPSDKVGYTDVPLLMKCCNSDGLILKPSRPALAIDAQILQAAFRDGSGPDGEVWTTFSEIGEFRFGTILAADMKGAAFELTPKAAGFGEWNPDHAVYAADWTNSKLPEFFSMEHPLRLDQRCDKLHFCLYYTGPVLDIGGRGLVIAGELSKWVPLSPQRVANIKVETNNVFIHLRGFEGETVEFWLVHDGKWISHTCVMSAAGTAVVSLFGCHPE